MAALAKGVCSAKDFDISMHPPIIKELVIKPAYYPFDAAELKSKIRFENFERQLSALKIFTKSKI